MKRIKVYLKYSQSYDNNNIRTETDISVISENKISREQYIIANGIFVSDSK